jgi:hypothetical protein
MKRQVSEESINATTLCDKGFSCLERDMDDLCKIGIRFNGDALVIKCQDKISCPYRISKDSDKLCSCPTRRELFDKYSR